MVLYAVVTGGTLLGTKGGNSQETEDIQSIADLDYDDSLIIKAEFSNKSIEVVIPSGSRGSHFNGSKINTMCSCIPHQAASMDIRE